MQNNLINGFNIEMDGNADAWSGASSAQNATRWNGHGKPEDDERDEYFAKQKNPDLENLDEDTKAKIIEEVGEQKDAENKEAYNQSVENGREFVIAIYNDPRTGKTVIAGSQIIGGASEFLTGISATVESGGIVATVGLGLALDGLSNISGGVTDIYNTWADKNYDGNFLPKEFERMSPENGRKVYNYLELGVVGVSLSKNVLNATMLPKTNVDNIIWNIPAKMQIPIDVINLDTTIKQIKKGDNKKK